MYIYRTKMKFFFFLLLLNYVKSNVIQETGFNSSDLAMNYVSDSYDYDKFDDYYDEFIKNSKNMNASKVSTLSIYL